MHEFIVQNDLQAIREILHRDPQAVDQLNESGLPPLYTAALYRRREIVDYLLEQQATVDIFASIYLGLPDRAEHLLKTDPDLVHQSTPDKLTPLHWAARTGNCALARLLLSYGADVNAVDQSGGTCLLEASHPGPWKSEPAADLIQLLLDQGAHVDLFQAAALGELRQLNKLLDQDPGLINKLDSQGKTALYRAAQNNQLAAVQLLVERGANLSRSDPVSIAALHRTSQECSDELIQYLIDHGADAHLCCYVACGDAAGTQRIMDQNPAAAGELVYELNAVGYAIHSWQLGTLRILLQYGCRLSAEDQQHVLRISQNNQELLAELLTIQNQSEDHS
ncbi:ankyrin repeat domain-containing protein [Gimesia chilikensis]|uniref:ankyrin repeat domain-containing protein n=1 Tax=Gimesia chilikensis TaxID=2605989 RepID=UPI0011893C1A|nr:ankyrin repeat domain-containing protein [Gimesia chilikensis]QDT87672.1 Ankyrin repeats (3 copies) [Gimesia chilikensis]